jgi:hypothetical protein
VLQATAASYALDYAIEARDGGPAHVRYVHSGILSDECHTLGQYLEREQSRAQGVADGVYA